MSSPPCVSASARRSGKTRCVRDAPPRRAGNRPRATAGLRLARIGKGPARDAVVPAGAAADGPLARSQDADPRPAPRPGGWGEVLALARITRCFGG